MQTTLSDSDIANIRQEAADASDADLSRLCSAALWGTPSQRRTARRKLAKAVAL